MEQKVGGYIGSLFLKYSFQKRQGKINIEEKRLENESKTEGKALVT
jgi:hypothetical protein